MRRRGFETRPLSYPRAQSTRSKEFVIKICSELWELRTSAVKPLCFGCGPVA